MPRFNTLPRQLALGAALWVAVCTSYAQAPAAAKLSAANQAGGSLIGNKHTTVARQQNGRVAIAGEGPGLAEQNDGGCKCCGQWF